MSYVEQVIKASGGHAAPTENLEEETPEGYHRMPDGTIMKDSEHEEEAALEKNPGDPCWDGYVQVGMKEKKGKMVPNCVPSSASIDMLTEQHNSEFGSSRHVTQESAYSVARSAYDKYSDGSCEEIYSGILWELCTFMEYSTTGNTDELTEMSAYQDLLPTGHPATECSVGDAISWISGAPELDNSARETFMAAFSDNVDYIKSLHASTRLRAMSASGSLSEDTVSRLKTLSERYSKVD